MTWKLEHVALVAIASVGVYATWSSSSISKRKKPSKNRPYQQSNREKYILPIASAVNIQSSHKDSVIEKKPSEEHGNEDETDSFEFEDPQKPVISEPDEDEEILVPDKSKNPSLFFDVMALYSSNESVSCSIECESSAEIQSEVGTEMLLWISGNTPNYMS